MRSVKDLVGSVLHSSEPADDSDREAGWRLASSGAVEIHASGPMLVVARVDDGGDLHDVELNATDDGLLARCNCTIVRTAQLCPHSFATAFVVWDES